MTLSLLEVLIAAKNNQGIISFINSPKKKSVRMGVTTGEQKASSKERLSQFLVSSMVSTYVGFERYALCKILGINVIHHSGLYECKVLQCRKKALAPILLTLI